MKKSYLLIVIFLVALMPLTAQVEIKNYTGVLLINSFADINDVSEDVTVRSGVDVNIPMSNNMSFNTLHVVEIDGSANIAKINCYYLKNTFENGSTLNVGYVVTPITLLRPYPNTNAGQFETATTAKMPGSGLGFRVDYKFGDLGLNVGVAERGKNIGDVLEYGVGLSYGAVKLAAHIGENDRGYGISVNHEIFSLTSYYREDKWLNFLPQVNISDDYCLGMDLSMENLGGKFSIANPGSKLEVFVIKNFKSPVDFVQSPYFCFSWKSQGGVKSLNLYLCFTVFNNL